MPEEKDYTGRVYLTLKESIDGFDKSESEFRESLKDTAYARKVYQTLKESIEGFDKSDKAFFSELGKPSPVTQPGGGGGLPLNGTPGMDGGRSPFGIQSIAEKIGKQPPIQNQPAQPITTLPYKGVDTGMGQLPAMTAPEEEMQLPPMEQALGGGDKNAMMPGVGIENLTPPTQEQLTSADPFLGWEQKKKEISKIEDPAKRNFKMGQQYERMAQAKQIENMDLAPMLMQGRHALESQYAELEALTQRINQTQDPNERDQLAAAYKEVWRSFEDARSEYDELHKRYQDNAKFAATMLKGSGQLGGSELSGLESAGMGVVDLGTSMLKSLGAAISGVDYITTLGQDGGYLKPLGEAIEGIADRQMEKSKATKEKHSKDIQKDVFEDLNWDNGSYLAGQLIGSILLTVGGGAAAGVRGGQAVAASQVYGDAVQKGRDAGLSEGGSMLFALPVTLAAAYFSDKGVEAMAGLLKGSSSAAIKSAVQSLGTKPTAAKILEASTRFIKNTVSGGLKEGSQEAAEFATEFGSKLVADQAGAEFKGEQLNMNEFLKGMQQNFVVGALGGTAFGGVFGESPANKISGIATKAAKDPKFEQKFLRDLQTFEDAGDITPEQKQEAMEYYQKAKTAASQVSPTVTNPEQASRATELIMEQEDLTAQIQQTNPAMVAPLHSKLDEVNAELGDIAIASMADIGQISEPTEAKPKKIKTKAETKPEAGSVGVGGDVKQQELDAQKINKEAGVDVYVARQGVETNGEKYTLSQIKENGNTNTFVIEDANGSEIGKAQLSADGNYLENIRIDENHRRKGLASKVYDFIELRKGIELQPSPNKQSKEAKALWDNRNLKKSVSNKANGGLLAKSLGEAMSKTFADFKNKQQVLLELENKYFEQKGLSKEDFNKLSETEKAEIIKDAVKWKNDNPELVKAVEDLINKNESNRNTTTEVNPKAGVSSNSNEGNSALRDVGGRTNTINGFKFTDTPSLSDKDGLQVTPLPKEDANIIKQQMFVSEKMNSAKEGVSNEGGGWYSSDTGYSGNKVLYNVHTGEAVELGHKKGGRMGGIISDFILNNERKPNTNETTPTKEAERVSSNSNEGNSALRAAESTAKALEGVGKEKGKNVFEIGKKIYDTIFSDLDTKENEIRAFLNIDEKQRDKQLQLEKGKLDKLQRQYDRKQLITENDINALEKQKEKVELIDGLLKSQKVSISDIDNQLAKYALDKYPNIFTKKETYPFYTAKGYDNVKNEIISEAYHKAKADGSNPELVKAVEDLLQKNKPTISKEQQPTDVAKEEGSGVWGDENAWGSDKGLTENFYTTDVDGYAIKKPITNPSSVTIDGVDFHIAKVDGDWKVIEKKSGLEISTGKISNTKNAAIEDATIRLAQNGGAKNLPTLIDRAIQGFKDRNTKAVEQSPKETTKAGQGSVGVGGDVKILNTGHFGASNGTDGNHEVKDSNSELVSKYGNGTTDLKTIRMFKDKEGNDVDEFHSLPEYKGYRIKTQEKNGKKLVSIHFEAFNVGSNRGGGHGAIVFEVPSTTNIDSKLIDKFIPVVEKYKADNYSIQDGKLRPSKKFDDFTKPDFSLVNKAVEQSLASQSKAEVTPEVVEEAVVEPVVEQPENKQPETAEKTLDDQKSKNKVSEETLNEQSNTEQDAEKIEVLTDETVDVPNKTIIAFHATPTGEVKSGKEAGIHIGTEKAAEQVKEGRNLGKGQVVPVSVKINKPLVLSDMPTWSSINLLSQLYNPSEGKYFGFSREQIQQVRDSDLTEKQKQQWVIDALKRKGFDAIAYKNDSEDAGKYSYVIFDEGNIELLNSNDESKTEQVQPVLEGVRDGGNQAEGRQEGQAQEITGLDAIAEEFGNAINEVEKAKSQEQKNAESEKMAQASLPFQEQAAEEARQEPMAEEYAGDMIGDVFSMLGEDEDADTPKPSSSQNLYAIHPSVGRMMQPPPPAPTSIFPPQVQERINNARKKPKENPFYKILDKIRAFGNYFARTNVELSGKQFAVVIDKLRLIKAAPQAAIRAANLHMRKILSGLNDTQRAHFQDYILAADLLGSIEDGTYATDLNWAGRKGPFGFNNFQEVRDSFANGEALLAADPKLLAAVQLRDRNINALFELSKKAGLVNGDQINNGRSYFHRQVLKYMEDGTLADAVMKSSARRKKLAQFKKRQGSLSDYYTNFAEVEFGIVANAVFEIAKRQYVNDIAKLYKPIHKQMLADAEKEVQDFIDSVESQFGTGSPEHTFALTSKKELEAKAFNNLMGDKYKLYFPDGKNSFFRSDVVLGTDVQDAIARMVAGQTGLGIQDLNDAMKPVVMLTKGRQMFLPVEVADVFDRLGNVKHSHEGVELAADVLAGGTTAFKKVGLLFPTRLLKYIGGNFAGDFDKSLATSPQIIPRAIEMAKLYWDIKNGKDNKFFNLAVKLGIVGSGSSAEIGDVSKEEWAKFATTRKPSLEGFLKNAMENMGGVKWSVEKYFELAGKVASAREDIFRLAAFSVALEKVNKGDKFYWFSRKTEIDQMPNNEEKAAKLAREIFGDYGAVSQGGEAMAKYLAPFYRFRETNIRGYKNFIFNNMDSKSGREKIIAYGIKRGVTRAVTMAVINTIRLATFTALVEIWNKMMFPDEEEELRDGGDQSFHIITGRNPDGTIQVYRTQGTLNAFMESMGITGVMQFYQDYENNDATMKDVAAEPAKAFTNEMYQQMSPFVKIPLELSAKKSRFPNVFKPRTIRQSEGWMLEHTLSSLALREPYEMLTDKPRRNKSISDIFLTSEMNPNQIAYYQSLNKISEDMGRFESFFTGGESIASKTKIKMQDAMHRWSMNSKFGKIEDAEKDLANYYALGGTPQSIEQSVKAKNPLNSYPEFIKVAIAELISNKQLVFKKRAGPKSDRITVSINHAIYSPTAEEVEYVKSLSKKDIKMFEMAMKYYEQSIKNPYENLKKQGHAKKK